MLQNKDEVHRIYTELTLIRMAGGIYDFRNFEQISMYYSKWSEVKICVSWTYSSYILLKVFIKHVVLGDFSIKKWQLPPVCAGAFV